MQRDNMADQGEGRAGFRMFRFLNWQEIVGLLRVAGFALFSYFLAYILARWLDVLSPLLGPDYEDLKECLTHTHPEGDHGFECPLVIENMGRLRSQFSRRWVSIMLTLAGASYYVFGLNYKMVLFSSMTSFFMLEFLTISPFFSPENLPSKADYVARRMLMDTANV